MAVTGRACASLLLLALISGLKCVNSNSESSPYAKLMKDTAFIVITQADSHHLNRAENFKGHFLYQSLELGEPKPDLVLTHEKWPNSNAWTILSIIPDLVREYSGKKSWVFFCEEDTRLDLKAFLDLTKEFNPEEKLFLGRALRDNEPTIIHHFAHLENTRSFAYPDFGAGFILSMQLLKSLVTRMRKENRPTDFAIDPKHELAMYIWNNGNGLRLKDVSQFCTGSARDNCVTYSTSSFPNCGPAISKEDIYVAVKTCAEFHKSRVPIVKKTWAKEAKHIEFISEKKDNSIPTISLGIPNTKSGHCAKTFGILERFHQHDVLKHKPWIIIADDDTIISITRLRKLLACYDPEKPVVLGERYGYADYDYITGGGGMVFSRKAVEKLVKSSCHCQSADSPDDMILGLCFKSLSIPLTHSPLFHQARPEDYSDGYLGNHKKHISFHKHWETDPIRIYSTLLKEKAGSHDEL